MVGEHVAVISSDVERINDELDALRAVGISEGTLRAEHAVLFSERRQDLATLANLAKSVASLSIAKAANTAADASAAFLQSSSFASVLAEVSAAIEETLADHPDLRAALMDRLWAAVELSSAPVA